MLAAAPAPPGFHARKHAAGKEYRYHLRRVAGLSPLDARSNLTVIRTKRPLGIAGSSPFETTTGVL